MLKYIRDERIYIVKYIIYGFMLLGIYVSNLYGGCYVKDYIPKNAEKYLPVMYKEVNKTIPIDTPYYFGSLIEQESCVRLCGNNYWARRCWSPISELKTKREQGVGFGQITRAWRRDGTLRFDTLANLKRKYPKELHELTWDNIKEKPDLQMKAIMLLWRDNFNMFTNDIPIQSRIAFADSIYNGGYVWLYRERQICKLKKGCDPDKWFGNVEKIKSARAKRKLYGNRTAWDINRHHVKDVFTRIDKYLQYYYYKGWMK